MARILNVKNAGVTLGVHDKDLVLAQDLIEVTFEDSIGVPHTVYAHRDGPFRTPEDVVHAWEQHELHIEPEHVEKSAQPAPPAGGVFE